LLAFTNLKQHPFALP